MKSKYITKLCVMPILLAVVLLASCSKDIDTADMSEMQPVKVRLNAVKTEFDSQGATRSGGSGTGWEDGETIYLTIGRARCTAVFKAASNDWEIKKTDGELPVDFIGNVEAYYFDKPLSTTASNGHVTLAATTSVYHASDGICKTYLNGDMDIALTLKPITSRIRFAGSSGIGIEVEGLKYYTDYDFINNQLTTSSAMISSTVTADGYTPYYYCEFADENRQLTVLNKKENVKYEKNFNSSVLTVGESGYVTIPTEDVNSGWTELSDKEFTVTGNGKTITFKMIKVGHGTFQMGQSANGSNETPVHNVTLTKDYYIGETEVTQGLWYAVMGQKPTSDGSAWTSSYGLGDNYPAYYISYEDCEMFLAKLNQMTGQNFRFPTEAEWEFAAKGGNKSKGYVYAGSNTIGDVAWYTDNSGSSSHVVKTKAANELGLYDMSGNVYEWCYDWWGNYSSSAQTDPTGDVTGSNRVHRGGGWSYPTFYCWCVYRCADFASWNRIADCGFRLAL